MPAFDRGHPDMAAIALRVADEIADAAPHRIGPERQHAAIGHRQQQRRAVASHGGDQLAQQHGKIGGAGFLAAFAAHEIDIALHHALHGVDIGLELGGCRVLLLEGNGEPHPRQRRAQIVRHAGQHLGALGHLAVQPLAHLEEGHAGLAHFGGAFEAEARNVAALAEIVGGDSEAAQRLDLVAHEERGDDEQHQG